MRVWRGRYVAIGSQTFCSSADCLTRVLPSGGRKPVSPNRRVYRRGWARKYFQPDLQSVVERGADSCCVLADFDLEPRPAGPQAAGDDYDGIEQQNRPV